MAYILRTPFGPYLESNESKWFTRGLKKEQRNECSLPSVTKCSDNRSSPELTIRLHLRWNGCRINTT